MQVTPANIITVAVVLFGVVAGIAAFEAQVTEFERYTERREAEIWKRVDELERELSDLSGRTVRLETLEDVRGRKD